MTLDDIFNKPAGDSAFYLRGEIEQAILAWHKAEMERVIGSSDYEKLKYSYSRTWIAGYATSQNEIRKRAGL